MKIGKYPVKHSYKIARLVSDLLSIGIAVLIFGAAAQFVEDYHDMLRMIGSDGVELIESEYSAGFSSRYLWVYLFPALVIAVFAAYMILTLKSHKFEGHNITRTNAQNVYNRYTFCVSVCKIPLLMGIFDVMYIFTSRMFGEKTSFFSFQLIIDALLILIIIRLTIHRIRKSEKSEEEVYRYGTSDGETFTVKLKSIDDDDEK